MSSGQRHLSFSNFYPFYILFLSFDLAKEDARGKEEEGISKNVLSKNPVAQKAVPIMNKWDYIQLKGFYTEKKTLRRANRQSVV